MPADAPLDTPTRRGFIQSAVAISCAAAWPVLLSGCGGGDGGTSAAASRLQVLAWGAFGELRKNWGGSSTLTLVRPDGTTRSYGANHTELNVPTSAAALADGSFWIADSGYRRLLRLNADLLPIGAITHVAGQRFAHPTGVALLPDGRLAVSDQRLGRLAIVNPDSGAGFWAGISADEHEGTGWRPQWATETDHRILEDPRFVQVSANGIIVVLDVSVARLVLFDVAGEAFDSIQLPGRPTGFAMAPDGTCYVCDHAGKTVNRVNLRTRSVETVLTAQQTGLTGGTPYSAAWRAASPTGFANLMISYR